MIVFLILSQQDTKKTSGFLDRFPKALPDNRIRIGETQDGSGAKRGKIIVTGEYSFDFLSTSI